MFLDNLSTSVLRICDENHLSYESASERCALSSRYFGDIARGRTAPTISTLEKLCAGFSATPNELLLLPQLSLPVSQSRCIHCTFGLTSYPVCPNCGLTLEREFQNYCDRCGQKLDWRNYQNATMILLDK